MTETSRRLRPKYHEPITMTKRAYAKSLARVYCPKCGEHVLINAATNAIRKHGACVASGKILILTDGVTF